MLNRLTVLTSVLLVTVLATQAGAVRRGDPNDVSGLLDISLTRFIDDDGIAQLTVVTYDDWRCRHLRAAEPTSLTWKLDGRGDRRFDLIGEFECRNGNLFFDLRSRNGANQYEPIEAIRPDRRTALVRFPMDLMELSGDHLTMIAKSRDSSLKCESDCRDRAPDRGRMRHPVP